MNERIYTVDEIVEEKPRGTLLVRNAAGKVFRAFQCWGCQTCLDYLPDPGGDHEKDRVEQVFPHFLSCEEIPQ
jgi:hypothetical protein